VDIGKDLTDFAETAAALANLDLLISVDTAPAHLAGALGMPVWVMLAHLPDWRWMLEREDSPWYPTMRLFRQSAPRNWDDPIRRIRQGLWEHPKRRG
jgi:ADP-heptose:LPS heptosyltransferase